MVEKPGRRRWWWVRRIASPVVLVSCSTRAATVTVSPIRVNSSLPAAADGASDHHTGVDSDADPKRAAEPPGDKAMNQYRGVHGGVGMVGEVVGGALAASFNRMQAGLAERQRLQAAFGTYVDPALAARLLEQGDDVFTGEHPQLTRDVRRHPRLHPVRRGQHRRGHRRPAQRPVRDSRACRRGRRWATALWPSSAPAGTLVSVG